MTSHEYEAGDDVDVLIGTRQVTGTIDEIETLPTLQGLEHRVHVAIDGRTIVCSPGQLRLT